MAREDLGTNIDQGVIQSLIQGVRYAVTGVTPSSWMSPGQPLQPIAQDEAKGRALDYPVGFNQRTRPRQGENISFSQLRALAENYDLLRIIIETRKDQVEAFEWEIVPKDDKDKKDYTNDIKVVTDFMMQPSPDYDWSTWIRAMSEDLFVLDAVAIYPRFTRGGSLMAFDLLDAATIKRVIGDDGRTPLPPDPAYQQILKGVPAVDYTSDELAYWMRNPRTWKLYGFGPVEQIIMTVNIALRRQVSQLQFYTEGNVPEALASVPETWTPEQIAQFQLYWDSILEGDTAARRHMKFIPTDANKVKFTKEAVLKDEFDEWLARICCFAFSIAPTPFIKQVNRATADNASDAAKEEGLLPLLQFFERRINTILFRYGGLSHLKFKWKMTQVVDPATQSQIHDRYVKNGTLSIDEVREEIGKEPIGVGNMIYTASGAVPINSITAQYNDDGTLKNPPTTTVEGASGNDTVDGGNKGEPINDEASKVTKVVEALIDKVSSPTINLGDTYVTVPASPAPQVNIELGDTIVQTKGDSE